MTKLKPSWLGSNPDTTPYSEKVVCPHCTKTAGRKIRVATIKKGNRIFCARCNKEI